LGAVHSSWLFGARGEMSGNSGSPDNLTILNISRGKSSGVKMAWVSAVILCSAPLAVAAADEYYVAQDISTKQCTIVESPPATMELVLLDNGKVFFDRNEAERVLASLSLCTSRTASAVNPQTTQGNGASKSIKSKARSSNSKSTAGAAGNSQSAGSQNPFKSLFTLFR
jgi:hypothetical protein